MVSMGIRAEARKELERQSKLRQDAQPQVEAVKALVAELTEADIPASLTMGDIRYKKSDWEAVLTLPPIPLSDRREPAEWPTEGIETVGYQLRFCPWGHQVSIEGPYDLSPEGGIVVPDESWLQDSVVVERFRTGDPQPDVKLPPLSDLIERVREMAITREVALMSAEAAPTP